MKKPGLILWLLIISAGCCAYTWIPFCPDSIHANNICFGVGSWKGVICSPGGMYLWEEDIQQWSFYTYGGLPVTGAAWLDGNKILVSMGNGSYSDGIYTFDLQTHQFDVVEWVVNPNFIHVVPVLDSEIVNFTDEYYVGSQFSGLYRSVDGFAWDEIDYFSGMSGVVMDHFENHIVVSCVDNLYSIHWSDDYGSTWNESVDATTITEMKFNNMGELYGIFPSFSNSSGLYKSFDFGITWEVVFWNDNMSAVGFDAMNTIFVGWESPTSNSEGIAIYDPMASPPGITFLNNGLASTNINKILMNPMMSAIAIFCCTDAGVYISYDYMTNNEETVGMHNGVELFPNPVTDETHIRISLPVQVEKEDIRIEIMNNNGIKVDEIVLDEKPENKIIIDWNKNYLSSGIYYLVIRTGHELISEKFVVF